MNAAAGIRSEEALIEEAVGHYFTAATRADPGELARAFHKDALMQSAPEGVLVTVSQPEWKARLAAATQPLPASTRRILSIDVEGTAASVKALADFPSFQFLDYLLLLKLEGGWQIVAKTFHRRAK
jgi:hypothetical protein